MRCSVLYFLLALQHCIGGIASFFLATVAWSEWKYQNIGLPLRIRSKDLVTGQFFLNVLLGLGWHLNVATAVVVVNFAANHDFKVIFIKCDSPLVLSQWSRRCWWCLNRQKEESEAQLTIDHSTEQTMAPRNRPPLPLPPPLPTFHLLLLLHTTVESNMNGD